MAAKEKLTKKKRRNGMLPVHSTASLLLASKFTPLEKARPWDISRDWHLSFSTTSF